jgi:class 3 adenylate cyclase
VALLFTDLRGSTALYGQVGDAGAYHLVREHFAFLAAIVRAHDGAIVKTIGDAIMAAFADPADGLQAALAVQRQVAAFNAGHGEAPLVLKLGLHDGPCIAVTLNDRLDYFGSTVNLAARLQAESRGGDIVVSRDMADDPAVASLLDGVSGREERAELKGFEESVPFLRLAP